MDAAICFLQHEVFMIIAGMMFFFYLKFSWMKNRGKTKAFPQFWADQNDEIGVSFIGGLIFLVWDDECLRAIEIILEWITIREETADSITMERAFYLLVSPFIERVYSFYNMISSRKSK